VLFGFLADRYGRTRALTWSILIYSVFTALCGVAQSVAQLAVFRVFLGLGMGGEWASGAALVSETWPAKHRGKALGLMQSGWAVGYALAALTTAIVLPRFGWRAVFFAGIIPALFALWVRARVPEPALWRERGRTRTSVAASLGEIFRGKLARMTLLVTAMNTCTLCAWWGLNLWLPAYLSLPPDRGGLGFTTSRMTTFIVVMQAGMWLGYVTFGYIGDAIGRKRVYLVYLTAAAALVLAYGSTRTPAILLVLGPLVAFFGTGYFSGFGAVTAELYHTGIRATAQGFTYNIGRVVSAAAPFVVGSLAEAGGFRVAFAAVSAAFVLAALLWIPIPDTSGRALS
jgi:MFS family permease